MNPSWNNEEEHMMRDYLKELPILLQRIDWGNVKSQFTIEAVADESLISNVSIIPTVGNQYVVMKIDTGKWELV